MLRTFVRAALTASLLSTSTVAVLAVSASAAAAADTVSKGVAGPLSEAQKLFNSGDMQGALAKVKEAQAASSHSDYDDYIINKFLSAISINLKDFATARTAGEAALASPAMPAADKKDLLHNAFVLESQANNYPGILKYGTQLEAAGPLDDSELTNMAIAYYNNKDTAHAQQYAQRAIDAAKAAGKPPPEAAQQILMGAQAQTNPAAAEQQLEGIVLQSSRPDDWDRLIEYNLGKTTMSDVFAMDLYRLKYVAHALKPVDAQIVGALAIQLHDYGDGVTMLQSIGATGSDFNNSRSNAAKEQGSLNAEIAAGSKGSATVALNVAEALYGYGKYAEAEQLARTAAAKGGGKYPGEAQILVGMSLVGQGKFADATAAFSSVSGSPGAILTARLWSIYARHQAGGAPAPAHP